MIRRLFDILVAFIGLTIAGIPMLLAALLVRTTSRGPVFYRQFRIGRGGRPFTFYKFRTMRCAPDGAGTSVTAEGDPRITRIGHVLRRWKLDELPQLLSVLTGTMSVIGPRPEMPGFVAHYTPAQRRVLDVKPGLASMAQLVYSNEAELLKGQDDPDSVYIRQIVPYKVAIDLEYESRRTMLTDLGLIVEIGLLVLGRRPRLDPTFHLEPPPRSS